MSKNIRLIVVGLTFSFLFLPLANAQKKLSGSEIKDIESKLKRFEYLETNFEQSKLSGLRGKLRKSEGKAYIAKEGQFKLVFTKPQQKELFFDGKELFQIDPKTKIIYRIKSASADQSSLKDVIRVVLDFELMSKNYFIEKMEASNPEVESFVLRPQKLEEVSSVEVEVSKKKNIVSLVRIYDISSQQPNTISFSGHHAITKAEANKLLTLQKDYKIKEI